MSWPFGSCKCALRLLAWFLEVYLPLWSWLLELCVASCRPVPRCVPVMVIVQILEECLLWWPPGVWKCAWRLVGSHSSVVAVLGR